MARNKKKTYRIYEQETMLKVDTKHYVIHHIDSNPENDVIENLVMLPKKLHSKYHFHKEGIKKGYEALFSLLEIPVSVLNGGGGYNDFAINTLQEFISVHKECCKWVDYREHCRGLLPNIHEIKLEERVNNE